MSKKTLIEIDKSTRDYLDLVVIRYVVDRSKSKQSHVLLKKIDELDLSYDQFFHLIFEKLNISIRHDNHYRDVLNKHIEKLKGGHKNVCR